MRPSSQRRHAGGFTLVELMVALVLGLIVSGAALALFVTNRQTYAATESLRRIEDNARTGYELLARDLREAGGNDCGRGVTTSNVLNSPASNWYTDWGAGIVGYEGTVAMPAPAPAFGTGVGQRVSGTDAIDLRAATSSDVAIVPQPGGNPADIKLSTVDHGFQSGDIVVACDPGHMAIFQLTNANPGATATVVHNNGAGSPGNCTKGLGEYGSTGIPATCDANGNAYTFGCRNGELTGAACTSGTWPAILAKLHAVRWYVGNNDHGTRSLYRATLVTNGGNATTRADEIADGVRDLQLTYLMDGASQYVAADSPTVDWNNQKITAIRIVMTVDDKDATGTNRTRLSRVLEHTVTFRNRAP